MHKFSKATHKSVYTAAACCKLASIGDVTTMTKVYDFQNFSLVPYCEEHIHCNLGAHTKIVWVSQYAI